MCSIILSLIYVDHIITVHGTFNTGMEQITSDATMKNCIK